MVEYHARGLWMWLLFKQPQGGAPITLALLQRQLIVLNVIFDPIEGAFDDWGISAELRNSGRLVFDVRDGAVKLTGFQDGRLQGEARGEIDRFWGSQESCFMYDAPTPDHCRVEGWARIPVVIRFELPLVLVSDCRGPEAPKACKR